MNHVHKLKKIRNNLMKQSNQYFLKGKRYEANLICSKIQGLAIAIDLISEK